MSAYQLAQLNIAHLSAPMDSPVLADFVANLDRINALADNSAGFVWRLQTEDGDATAIRHFGDDRLVNMSVWENAEALHSYVYKSAHAEIMRRRKEWFTKMRESYIVLWWVPRGHHPSLAEAAARLKLLREQGPSAEAFTLHRPFAAPDEEAADDLTPFDDTHLST